MSTMRQAPDQNFRDIDADMWCVDNSQPFV